MLLNVIILMKVLIIMLYLSEAQKQLHAMAVRERSEINHPMIHHKLLMTFPCVDMNVVFIVRRAGFLKVPH